MRIAMVSEHASPLAALGGVDAGGQNVHVAALARGAGRARARGRRSTPGGTARTCPSGCRSRPASTVVHVPAGPAAAVPKDELLPLMAGSADWMARRLGRHGRPGRRARPLLDVRPGRPAARPRALGVPVVQTFHALGTVKRRHQGARDTSPAERLDCERHLAAARRPGLATCRDEVGELRPDGRADRTR